MTPLNRALTFDERQHRAVRVGEQLNLDVTRPVQATFEDVTPEMQAPYFAEIGADELKFP